jgi:RHS repeat-associated protein
VLFEKAPDEGTTSYAYDVASNVISETRPRGQGRTGEDLESFQTRMTYDEADRLKTSTQQVTDGTDLVELVTSMQYDADDNLTKTTEPGAKPWPGDPDNNEVTSRVFDGRGLPWKVTTGFEGDERTSIVEYDENGNLRRLVNPRGVDQTTEDAESTDTGEDTNANLEAASQHATVFRYGDNDLLLAERMPWNGANDKKYRRLFHRTDNDPNTVDDTLGRLLTIVSPHEIADEAVDPDQLVARTSYSYYANDWIRSASDQKLGKLSGANQPVKHRLLFYDYDERGAQKEWNSKNFEEDEDGRHITRTFWPNGQLRTRIAKKTTEADDATTARRYEYFYNRNQSLAATNDIRGAKDDADPNNDPDPNDRLTRIDRDPVERQSDVNETWSDGKDSRFSYDEAGNVITRQTDGKIQPNGSFGGADPKTTTFEYDSLDREFRMLVEPTTGADRETITNYWPSGQRQSRRKPNGTSDRWFFNSRGDVTRRERQRDGQSAIEDDDDVGYHYDANGNRDRDERGRFEFNARDQLVEWQKPGVVDVGDRPEEVADDDYSGQLTSYEVNGDGAITKTTLLPPEGQIQTPVITNYTYTGERLVKAETGGIDRFYRYDDFGNLTRIVENPDTDPSDETEDGTTCAGVPADLGENDTYYCYDEFERLRLAKAPGGAADPDTLDYDAIDRRDLRTFVKNGNEVERDFSYVGMTELLSRDVENDGTKRFYDYDSQGDRVGQQVQTGASNRYRAYVKDANGSVLGLEDDNGVVDDGAGDGKSTRYEYDPYGELENASSLEDEAEENPFRFEGFYYDSAVKTYDMLARSYRPDIARFLTVDRLASASQNLLLQADPLTQNRYAFAGANPVNNVEFDGHCPRPSGTGGPCRGMGNSAAARAQNRRSSKVAKKLDKAAAPGWKRYHASQSYTSGRGIPAPRVTTSAPRSDVGSSAHRKAGPDPLVDAKDDKGHLRAQPVLGRPARTPTRSRTSASKRSSATAPKPAKPAPTSCSCSR